MNVSSEERSGLALGHSFVLLAIALFGVRFALPVIVAGGTAETGAVLGPLSVAYSDAVAAIAFGMTTTILALWPAGFHLGRLGGLVISLLAVSVALYLGEVDPALRLVSGPWASLALGMSMSATIVAFGMLLDLQLRKEGVSPTSLGDLQTLFVVFAIAYLLRSIRLVDFEAALGSPLAQEWIRVFDYGPFLLVSAASVRTWILRSPRLIRNFLVSIQVLGPPFGGAVFGAVAAFGLGGFYLSSALTWGGSYTVFNPTGISLSIVGFAVGAFLSLMWTLRGRLSTSAWRFVVGGVVVASLAGLMPFRGSLGSLAGIVLGLTLASRGLRETLPHVTSP